MPDHRAPFPTGPPGRHVAGRRIYVLDTSVLLADPSALGRFHEHEVVVPVVVLNELEAKRHHPELGWAARSVLRRMEDLRLTHGTLTVPLPINEESGTARVELNHQDLSVLPSTFTVDNADHRILAVARNLAAEGRAVTLVSKDLPLRLKASIVGLDADEYRNEQGTDDGWTGFVELDVVGAVVDELFAVGSVDVDEAKGLPCNCGLALSSGSQSALGRIRDDKRVHLVRGEQRLFDVVGRNAEQRIAIDLLGDPDLGIVSMGGRAGTGKSCLALAAGLESVLERRTHRRVTVFRPLFAVGGQDLGFLPGDRDDKMGPWSAAVNDALESIAGPSVVDQVLAEGLIEVLPLTHIRGRTLTETFVIVDEAQNLERGVLLTALSRLGEGSRVVLTHDIAQRDNLRVGRHDGIISVVDSLRGHPLFGHVTLTRSERSAVAALVTRALEGGE